MKWFSSTTFASFRIILGIYLVVHFVQLLPVCEELFSNQGVIKNASILPSYDKLPLHIFKYDNPISIRYFIISLIGASILFTIGILRRFMSLWLYYGWMCLQNRNPLISNPSIGYIGWIFLACVLIPGGERIGFFKSKEERKIYYKKYGRWQVPDILYYGFIIVIGFSYTASGIHKLQCPSWIDGTALYYVLSGPLAYQNFLVDMLLCNNNLIWILSYGSMFLELSSLIFGTFSRLRCIYWFMYMSFHIGILLTVNFGDLTIGMLVTHLFTFDPSWFEFTKKLVQKYDWDNHPLFENDINHTDKFNQNPLGQNFSNVVKEIKTSSVNQINSSQLILNWIIGVVILIISIVGSHSLKENLYHSLMRFLELTLDMYWGFGLICIVLVFLMTLERIYPDQELKYVEGWWKWVLIINAFQLFASVLASFTWENWLQDTNYFKSDVGFHLNNHVSPLTGGFIAYLIAGWVMYYWQGHDMKCIFCGFFFINFIIPHLE